MENDRTYRFYLIKRTIIFLFIFLMMLLVIWGVVEFQKNWFHRISAGNSGASDEPALNQMPSWLTVYFTNPNPPDNLGQGIDQYVQTAIDGAKETIDLTSFDMNLPNLMIALVNANNRGVMVRVVYDGVNGNFDINNALSENKFSNAIKTLTTANVVMVDGSRQNGLMHDKMMIVDRKILFVGSWNFSYNDTYRNNNNLLQITEMRIIENYQAKFNEMFVDKRFGSQAHVKIPNPSIIINGIRVDNYMAPEDRVLSKLVSLVKNAKRSIHFMSYVFTSDDLANAMIARSKAGVVVEGVIENRSAYQRSLMDLFLARVEVKTDGNKYMMHHKVIIIDGEIVVTGSFNFTKAADTTNDDNVLVIHNREVASLFEQEFQKIFGEGENPGP